MSPLGLPVAAAALFAAAVAGAEAPPTPLTLGEWIARDRALAGNGIVDPEQPAMRQQHDAVVAGLGAARRAEEARRAAGEPAACLPPPGRSELTSQEIGTWLHARPAEEHGVALAEALAGFLRARFPCA